MNMTENARFILGLRAAGWTEKEINDFLLFIETGEEQYKPKDKTKSTVPVHGTRYRELPGTVNYR